MMCIADTLTDGDNMQKYELFMIEDALGRKKRFNGKSMLLYVSQSTRTISERFGFILYILYCHQTSLAIMQTDNLS